MQAYGPKAIKVYIVDDHDIVRRGLRDLMAVKHDIYVVGDSGSAGDAIERIVSLQPDVMVLDLHLQESSGIHVCRTVRGRAPKVRGLLVTSAAEDDALVSALLAGASGYATKLGDSSVLLGMIRRVGTGQTLIEPAIAENAAGYLLDRVDSGAVQLPAGGRQVLELMLAGHTDGEIATETGRSPDDVAAAVGAVLDTMAPLGWA